MDTSKRPGLLKKIIGVLWQYVRTQFVVMAILTVVTYLILTVLDVRYVGILAVLTGTLSVIPVFGMGLAALLSGIIAVFDGVRFLSAPPVFEGLAILVIYFLLNQLIDLFLTPYLVGRFARINPFIIFCSVFFGTIVFGIAGALCAIPAVLVLKTIGEYYRETHRIT